MNHPEIQNFIKQHRNLFWYTPEEKMHEISESFLVETILIYGDWGAVKTLINLLGMKKAADIFFQSVNTSERRKGNYPEITLHFFTLFFKRYAS
jgi:hypothetical protein